LPGALITQIPFIMTISETTTEYLLFRGSCGFQWCNDSFIIVSCDEYLLNTLSTAKMRLQLNFDKVLAFRNFTLDFRPTYFGYAPSSLHFIIDNYSTWPSDRGWTFINSAPEELNDYIDIPLRSEQTYLEINKDCCFRLIGALEIGAAIRTMETAISEILTACDHTKISYLSK